MKDEREGSGKHAAQAEAVDEVEEGQVNTPPLIHI
jgi:hypothetical protein